MKLATIEQIESLIPIENADNIVIAKVLGWDIVVKKNEFSVGDLCVYIPIDTQVDTTVPCLNFMSKHASKSNPTIARIKTIRLKGVWSQGLVVPVTCLPEEARNLPIGTDVASYLGVTKYEKESIITPQAQSAGATGTFPTVYISKTDEDNLRNIPKILQEFMGKSVYITKKMDGSSMTIIMDASHDIFNVCSRNYALDVGTVMYQYVVSKGIKDRLLEYGKNLAIQGEFCGPKINKNQMNLPNYEFYVFTVKDLDTKQYYGWEEMVQFCEKLNLNTVPLVETVVFDESYTVKKLQELANSQLYGKNHAEGIVIRPMQPVYSAYLQKMLSVKLINQYYKD